MSFLEQPPAPPAQRPGIETTEFWLACVCLVCGVVLMLAGHVEAGTALVAIATGGHHLSRAWVKGKVAGGP